MGAADQHEPCPEYFDIGPFRFECDGHIPGAVYRAVKYHDGKLTHHALSPQQVGDVDVTFWTAVTWDDVPDDEVDLSSAFTDEMGKTL